MMRRYITHFPLASSKKKCIRQSSPIEDTSCGVCQNGTGEHDQRSPSGEVTMWAPRRWSWTIATATYFSEASRGRGLRFTLQKKAFFPWGVIGVEGRTNLSGP